MGIPRAAVKLLLDEAVRQRFSGSIVTLGRQHVYVTADEVRRMATERGIVLPHVPEELHREPKLAARGFVSDDCLFGMLGFEKVVRVDYSDYEAPDEILDLNSSQTPAMLERAFDVVLDFGTIEHIFDIAAALRHCCRMVRPGGRIIHLTPSSNCVEHGFFSVSPTLFSDFYSASGFDVDRVLLCRLPGDTARGVWNVYDYLGHRRDSSRLECWMVGSGTRLPSRQPERTTLQECLNNTSIWRLGNSRKRPRSKARRMHSSVNHPSPKPHGC